MTMIGITIVEIMMYLRVYVLYSSKRLLLCAVAFLLLFQIGMNGWLLTKGQAVEHNQGSDLRGCTMIFDPTISGLASSSAWLPLLYETVVFALVAYKTVPSIGIKRGSSVSHTMARLFEDGLLYYTTIFSVTLVLTLMIVFAEPGTKNIVAQLELLLTVAMMSRITLNLKKSAAKFVVMDPDEQVTAQLNQNLAFSRSLCSSARYPPPSIRSYARREVPSCYYSGPQIIINRSVDCIISPPDAVTSRDPYLLGGERSTAYEHWQLRSCP